MVLIETNSEVFVISEPNPPVLGKFKVEVWGKEPYDYVRAYEISAKSATLAAQEGISRFKEEMNRMFSEEQ